MRSQPPSPPFCIIGFGILIPRSPEPLFSVTNSTTTALPTSAEAKERARERRRKRREREAFDYQRGIAESDAARASQGRDERWKR